VLFKNFCRTKSRLSDEVKTEITVLCSSAILVRVVVVGDVVDAKFEVEFKRLHDAVLLVFHPVAARRHRQKQGAIRRLHLKHHAVGIKAPALSGCALQSATNRVVFQIVNRVFDVGVCHRNCRGSNLQPIAAKVDISFSHGRCAVAQNCKIRRK
jgi:hypothetical protein